MHEWSWPSFGLALSVPTQTHIIIISSACHNENLFKSQSNPLIYRREKFGWNGTIAVRNRRFGHSNPLPITTLQQHQNEKRGSEGWSCVCVGRNRVGGPSSQDGRFIINLNCTVVSVAALLLWISEAFSRARD